jgi:hypothetical protein
MGKIIDEYRILIGKAEGENNLKQLATNCVIILKPD